MWKDNDDGWADIKGAPYEFPSEAELNSLENSDISTILDLPHEDRMEKLAKAVVNFRKHVKKLPANFTYN